jgi:Dolichyl-phosphate-mannose-protein mannosyltransferase
MATPIRNPTPWLRHTASVIFAVLLLVHTGLLAWSAWRHSPVLSETGHLPAGISHWQLGRFDLYRVNPPLVRLVAAVPVLWAEPAIDWGSYSTDPTARGEARAAIDFAYVNGRRTFWLYTLGRWACIPFSWIGAWVCYRWARDLYGAWPGVVAAALWCFCPNILGNGSLMMPDMPCAALGAASCYAFWRWLKDPTWLRAGAAGVVLGLAELTKTTLLLFYPLWPLLWAGYRLSQAGKRPPRVWVREIGMLGVQMLVSLYVINLGYLFEGSGQRLAEYRFQSHALTGLPDEDRSFEPGNRFAGTWLGALPVPLPMNYVQGIDTQKVDFERGEMSYLRGQWREPGWWYFYLYALAIKVPLGTWVLAVLAAWVTFSPGDRLAAWRDEMLVLAPLGTILAFVSSQTGFSIHFRYVLPIFPFLFAWASKAAWTFRVGAARLAARSPESRSARGTYLFAAVAAAALGWSVGSSLWYYPHSLAYFNELVGGPEHGHEHLLDSSLDWGQDLLYLKEWYDAHPEARPLHFAAYGSVDPGMTGLGMETAPVPPGPSAPGWARKAGQQLLGPLPGWYAIDVYYLHSPDGGLNLSYFGRFRPIARAGYSIYLYHITAAEANRVRRESQMDELDSPP